MLTDFQIFTMWAYKTMVENVSQQIGLFNAATKGGLVLTQGANVGDFTDAASYKFLNGVVCRRDQYGTGSVSTIDIAMILDTSVKVNSGTPPINMPPSFWKFIQRSPDEAGFVVGNQLAQQSLQDKLNVAIKAFVAALANDGETVYDGTAGTATLTTLMTAAMKFGDRAQAIQCWVMHSKNMTDIFATSLANSQRLFNFGNVQVLQDGFGRPFVVTDSPDLIYTSSGTKYRLLGLVPGAVVVEDNGDFTDNLLSTNGNENILRSYQAEWSYQLGVKGFAWDKTNGGKSPNNAAIATGSNWDKYVTSFKDLAGVMANVQ